MRSSHREHFDFQKLHNSFVVIIPAYNAATTIERAIRSVLNQDFGDLGVIIRDDMSTDLTANVIKDLFSISGDGSFHVRLQNRDVLYVRNNRKLYGGGNTYDSAINFVKNREAIIGVVDADDYLLSNNAISIVYDAYVKNSKKWLIWTQHIAESRQNMKPTGFSNELPENKIIYSTRDYWSVSHFRTCKAGLFNLVSPFDLEDPFQSKCTIKVAGDAAFLYPIIEMCGKDRALFIDEPFYFYSDKLSTNESAIYETEVADYSKIIRSRSRYSLLHDNFIL